MYVFYKVEDGRTFQGKKVLHSSPGRAQRCATLPDKTIVVSRAPWEPPQWPERLRSEDKLNALLCILLRLGQPYASQGACGASYLYVCVVRSCEPTTVYQMNRFRTGPFCYIF